MKNVLEELKGVLIALGALFVCSLPLYPEAIQIQTSLELPEETEKVENPESDSAEKDFPSAKSLDTTNGDAERIFNQQEERYSPLNIYNDNNAANVSPQNGSVDVDMKDIVLKGKNFFDLEIARHYDTGTAISDAVESGSWCPGDIAYSMGTGWRLTLPYIKTDTSTNWDEREKKTCITLPSGARYYFKEMKYIGGSNPRTYEYHDVDDFRIEFYPRGSDGEYYLLTQRNGTCFELSRDGLVTTICGRVDGVKGGVINIFYRPDKTIEYIGDTMNRRVYFTYGIKGSQSKPTIVRVDVRDSSGLTGTDPYERAVDYTISDARLLCQVTCSGIGGVNRSWHYGYVSKQLKEFVSGRSKTNTVFLLQSITNPEKGRTKISDGSANDYYKERFYFNREDWKEKALASGVSTYNGADGLLCATKYTYSTSRHQSTSETYVKRTVEEQTESVNNVRKQVIYSYIERIKNDIYGAQKVYTLLSITEAYDPSHSLVYCSNRNETYYYETTQRIKEDRVYLSSDNYRIEKYAYDNWGNVTWTAEQSMEGDRENKVVTWIKFADVVYIPPGQIQDGSRTAFPGEEDAPWIVDTPPFSDLPAATQGPKPHNLVWKKVVKNHYPTIDASGIVRNMGGYQYHHNYFQFDAERQRTGNAEWNGEEWLCTSYSYQSDGRLSQIKNPEGHITSCSYDDEYSADVYVQTITEKEISDADGTKRDITGLIGYEIMSGWVKWKKNPRGYVREYKYDPLGRVLVVIEADDDDDTGWMPDRTSPSFRRNNPQTLIQYDDLNMYFEVEDPLGRRVRSYTNNFGNIVKNVHYGRDGYDYFPEAVTSYEYDGLHRLIGEIKPVNGTDGSLSYRPATQYRYDAFGRKSGIIQPDGNQVVMEFNYHTNTLNITNERGFRSEEQYDLDDRLVRRKEYGINKTRESTYYYDGLGNEIIAIDPDDSDPKGRITVKHYNQLNQLEKIEYPNDFFYENGKIVTMSPYSIYEYNRAGYKTKDALSKPGGDEHAVRYELDELGRVVRIRFFYTDDGALKEAITEIFYDLNGNKTKIIDANNTHLPSGDRKPLQYTYSANDDVVFMIDPEGNTVTYKYYSDGRLQMETDPRGFNKDAQYPGYTGDFTTIYYYDWLGRLSSKELSLNPGETAKPVVQYTYYPNGNRKNVIAADGGVVTYTYTSRDWIKSETLSGDGKAYTTTHDYDALGNEVAIVDSRGFVTRKLYDEWDRLECVVHPELNQEHFAYDKNDNLVSRIDGRGNRTYFAYTKYDKLKRMEDGKHNITEYGYDRLGNLTRTEGAVGNITTYEYDELSRLIKEVKGLPNFSHQFQYRYDAMGNMVFVRDPNNSDGVYEYDGNNRLKKISMNQGARIKTIQFEYDEAGYKKWIKDDGVEIYFNNAERQYLPDPYGHVTRETDVIDGMEFSTEYSYDVVGRVKGIRYPSGEWVRYEYNRIGEVIQVPGYIMESTICYDRGGVLESAQAANGLGVRWERDGNGRLTGLSYHNGRAMVKEYSYSYDEADNVIRKNDNRYAYDEVNRLVYESRTDIVETRYQSRVGRVEDDFTVTKPLEFVVQSAKVMLDNSSSSIGVDLGLEVNVDRIELIPSAGNPVSRVYTNENCLLACKSETNSEGSYTKLLKYTVNGKENGIIEFLFSTSETARFLKVHCGYDDRDEYLAPVNRSEFQNRAEDLIRVYAYLDLVGEDEYVYDEAGNRTSERITEGVNTCSFTNITYSNTNRLMSDGRFAFKYDANGNVVQKGTKYEINGDQVTIHEEGDWWEFSYDFLNRLVEVKKNGKPTAAYQYDGLGRKVKKSGKRSGTAYYISSPEGRILYVAKGKRYREHVYVFGELFARTDGEKENPQSRATTFYHIDNIGSVTEITDGSGAVVWSCEYSAFGKPIGERGCFDSVPIFAGKEYDEEAKLYYFNARWYDPDNGRFISEDPAQDGLNWFTYAGNNPLTYRDPTGLRRDGGDGGGNSGNRSSNRSERQADRQERRDQRQEARQERREARQEQRVERKQERQDSRQERREARRLAKGENGGIDYPDLYFDFTSILLMQFDLSLNPYDGFHGLFRDKTMAKHGCHLRALQAFAETYVGIPLTAKQVREARRELRTQGVITGNLAVAPDPGAQEKVINDAFSRLGHPELSASVTEYFDKPPGLGEADGTIVRGSNPRHNHRSDHSQLGDTSGSTVWDPGYRISVELGTADDPKRYRYIKVN